MQEYGLRRTGKAVGWVREGEEEESVGVSWFGLSAGAKWRPSLQLYRTREGANFGPFTFHI